MGGTGGVDGIGMATAPELRRRCSASLEVVAGLAAIRSAASHQEAPWALAA